MMPPPTEIPEITRSCDAEEMGREWERLAVEIVERDRQRFAGALHNSACQSLSGLQLLSATLLRKLPAESGELREDIGELSRLLRQVSTELRGVVQWLRPPPVREEGLIVSLLELAAEVSPVIPCEFRCEDRRIEVAPYVAEQLYQIAHATVLAAAQRRMATRIEIGLAAGQNGVRLSVWADRDGPACEADLCNWELLHLRSRAIGGKLTIHSPDSGGTGVTCHVESP
jgi:two-component system sensor kinase FixL